MNIYPSDVHWRLYTRLEQDIIWIMESNGALGTDDVSIFVDTD